MLGALIIESRVVGTDRPIVPDWSLPFEPGDGSSGGEPVTLEKLIRQVVAEQVRAFRERQKGRRFVRFLTERQIAESAKKGKVDMGGRYLKHEVDEEEASDVALQAFEDGLYLVLIDGEQKRDLEELVYVNDGSRVRFVRLVMLTGW